MDDCVDDDCVVHASQHQTIIRGAGDAPRGEPNHSEDGVELDVGGSMLVKQIRCHQGKSVLTTTGVDSNVLLSQNGPIQVVDSVFVSLRRYCIPVRGGVSHGAIGAAFFIVPLVVGETKVIYPLYFVLSLIVYVYDSLGDPW